MFLPQKIITVELIIATCITFGINTTAQANSDQNTISWTKTNINTAYHHIIPRYQRLKKTTGELSQEINTICQRNQTKDIIPSTDLLQIQTTLRKAYTHWADIQHITFGPIAFLQRAERIQYWPDKHKVGGKQLSRLLNAEKTAPSLEELQAKSVAVQGLPALERIIFSRSHSFPTSKCYLAQVISQNIANIAQETHDAWAYTDIDFASEFKKAEHGNGFYYSSEEISGVLLNSLTTQLKITEQRKLGYALGQNNKRAKSKSLEAWRSELSLLLINRNISSLHQLYSEAFRPHLMTKNIDLAKNIQQQFINITLLSSSFNQSLHEISTQKSNNSSLQALQEKTQHLYKTLSIDMAKSLNVSMAFNALDGD